MPILLLTAILKGLGYELTEYAILFYCEMIQPQLAFQEAPENEPMHVHFDLLFAQLEPVVKEHFGEEPLMYHGQYSSLVVEAHSLGVTVIVGRQRLQAGLSLQDVAGQPLVGGWRC